MKYSEEAEDYYKKNLQQLNRYKIRWRVQVNTLLSMGWVGGNRFRNKNLSGTLK